VSSVVDSPKPSPAAASVEVPACAAQSVVGTSRCPSQPAMSGSSYTSRVVAEIIDTERKYVRDLRQIVHVSSSFAVYMYMYKRSYECPLQWFFNLGSKEFEGSMGASQGFRRRPVAYL